MKKIILVLIVMVSLISCNSRPSETPTHAQEDDYIITNFDPPKHVYVDLKRVSDGAEFHHVYVSKHCNDWEDYVTIGDTIALTRYTYQDGGDEYISFDNNEIRECLCQ